MAFYLQLHLRPAEPSFLKLLPRDFWLEGEGEQSGGQRVTPLKDSAKG